MPIETKVVELLQEILHELKMLKHTNYTVNVTSAPRKIKSYEEFFKSPDSKIRTERV